MKATTMLLIAGGFLAGVAAGTAPPLAKAEDGLARLMGLDAKASVHTVRVTVSVAMQRDGFQPADFRWSPRANLVDPVVCAPKSPLVHGQQTAVQHL